jgi:DNA-directed RNA polymerase specialized sigma24 family protein
MPTHLDNEQSLVAAAQAGDSDAFVTLLNQYSRHIYRLGVSITGNHHDAEDVLQEASLKAYTALADFHGNSRFYTWLVRIAVNVALGKLRKRALKPIARVDLMCVDQFWCDACNVDGHVQPPECFHGERYQALHVSRFGNIASDGSCLAT